MSDIQNIRRALEKRLKLIEYIGEIAFENAEFDPSGLDDWIRARVEFSTRRPASVGVNSDILHQGLFLVDVFVERNNGTALADEYADLIMDDFSYGTVLTESGVNVKIRFAERAGAIYNETWYQVPITITWYAYI